MHGQTPAMGTTGNRRGVIFNGNLSKSTSAARPLEWNPEVVDTFSPEFLAIFIDIERIVQV